MFFTKSKLQLTTKEAFKHFIENRYKTIKPKPDELRQAKIRFKQNKLSEDRMIEILTKFKYTPKAWKSIPSEWHAPK